VGLGAGLYWQGFWQNSYIVTLNSKNYLVITDTENGLSYWGFYPKMGISIRHLTFQVEYNFFQPQKVKLLYTDPASDHLYFTKQTEVNGSYLAVKVSLFLGRI